MENSKTARYYTPDISEFHVGFEFQFRTLNGWEKRSCKEYDFSNYANPEGIEGHLKEDRLRVKHLDIEDILSFGFTVVDEYDDLGQATFEKGEWFVVWTKDATEIHYGEDMVFCGKLKNKSEFGRILKQLEIHESI